MNKLVLKEMNDDRILYLYYPEGRTAFGEIEYLFDKMQAQVVRRADTDDTGYYGNKAMFKVEECVVKNNLPMRFTQAWY